MFSSSYIDRNEDELLEIKSNRFKPSNKHISRELDITYCRKMEREEYDSTGFGKHECSMYM